MVGANWMNLNGSAGQVMLPLLRILSSSDQLHRSHQRSVHANDACVRPELHDRLCNQPHTVVCGSWDFAKSCIE